MSDHFDGYYDDYGYAPHVARDGWAPSDYGHAVLASGNIAVVQSNGEVSEIMSQDDFYWYNVDLKDN